MLHFLWNFLRLKNNFSISGGFAKFKTVKCDSLEFRRDWTYQPRKHLVFALLDLQDTPRHSATENYAKNPHFSLLLATLQVMKTPSISMPMIINSKNKLAQAVEYAKESFTSYTIRESKYILAKNEQLYDGFAWKQSLDVSSYSW